MSGLARRKLYLVASTLLLAAIAAQVLAKRHAGRGMLMMARAAGMPEEQLQLRPIANWHAHRSDLWNVVSLGLAALAVGFWVAFGRGGEPGLPIVLLALTCLYLLLLFLQV